MAANLIDFDKYKLRALSNFGTGETCHLGHILLQCLTDHPDHINQIDAATGRQETNAEVLRRSTRLAQSMNKFGLKPGDVVAVSAPNLLDTCIPYYSAIYNGLPIMGVDPTYKYEEIRSILSFSKPKIIFCHSCNFTNFNEAVKSLGLETKMVTFQEGDYTLEDFIKDYSTGDDIQNFKAAHVDIVQTYSWLVSTSGSTGVPKLSALSVDVVLDVIMFFATSLLQPDGLFLMTSPVQWITYYIFTLSGPIMRNTVLKTSAQVTTGHLIEVINKYKPNSAFFSPSSITQIMKQPNCNITCFNYIIMGGSKIYKDLLLNLKTRTKARVFELYGQSESQFMFFIPLETPLGSCGKPSPRFQVKLVDFVTENDINEANVPGELYVKGPIFAGYYNNPEETAKVFTEDGWLKTGDSFYKDEKGFYYFVERIKMLIKYKNYQIWPSEIEVVLREHPDIVDVAVTGIEDADFGELPAACIIKKSESNVTVDDIKDLIANRLSEAKQLRGGVVFVDRLPLTSTGKIARNKLKDVVKYGSTL